MFIDEIKLFELLKAKIGEKEAEAFVVILENKVNGRVQQVEKTLKEDIASLKEYIDKVFSTKEDLANVKGELKQDFANVRAELKADIANSRADTIKWMVGLIIGLFIALMGSMAAMIKLMMH